MAKVNNTILDAVAESVRVLSADATRKANSGHPGLPLGLAELGALLFAEEMNYNPKNPQWENRDRLVLSAGHGSMWLYSLLHLSGYAVSINDIKKFRQLKSKTPGHPEFGHTVGVETTTGPLGAGFSNAVGMAVSEEIIRKKFGSFINYHTYIVAGDGCMMEGITSEAASFAGHQQLGKLICFYDSNGISIEGSTDLAFTEDVGKRFKAYGWQVLNANAHDYDSLRNAIKQAKSEKKQPSIIICKSIIGKGAPTLQGTAATHGAPLPADEIAAMKKNMKIDVNASFVVQPNAQKFFEKYIKTSIAKNDKWKTALNTWKKSNKALAKEWEMFANGKLPSVKWPKYKIGDSLATRKSNGACIAAISEANDLFVGGSADLEPSNNTKLPNKQAFQASKRGRMMHYGVREHAMGGIVNGMVLSGLKGFGATFLVFSDYMRPALRLASIMRIPSLFVFTHDSIFVGEDGPTHQPVEHVPALRLIPNLRVYRPADAEESVLAWKSAYSKKQDPNALIFTRQNLKVLQKPKGWATDAQKGAYIVQDCKSTPDVILVATGSEVAVALDAASVLTNKKVRVVSMLCKELFDEQSPQWKNRIVGTGKSKRIIVEAAIPMGWDSLSPVGHIGIESFGACGPAAQLQSHYGLTGVEVAKKIRALLK